MGISNICKNDKKLMFRMFKQYPEFFLNIAKSMIDVKTEMIEYALNHYDYWDYGFTPPSDPLDADPHIEEIENDVMEHAIADFEEELEHYDFKSFKESLGGR